MKKLSKILVLNIFSFIIILSFGEILSRIFINYEADFYAMPKKSKNKKINIHPYGEIPINSNGFYDKEWSNPKTKLRYGYFGDSVAYGVGSGYPYRITEYLDELIKNVEHVNITKGIGTSFNDLGSLDKINNLIKNYQIDKIIYLMNLNDISPLAFSTNSRTSHQITKKVRGIKNFNIKTIKQKFNFLDKLFRGNSYLYTHLRYMIKNIFIVYYKVNISGYPAIELEPDRFTKEIKIAAEKLAIAVNNLSANNINICTIILPYEMQISSDAANVYKEKDIYFEESFLDFSTQKIFVEQFKKSSNNQIYYLNNNFKQDITGTYFVFNLGDKIDFNHPNRLGNKILSEQIKERRLCHDNS